MFQTVTQMTVSLTLPNYMLIYRVALFGIESRNFYWGCPGLEFQRCLRVMH
jgi:hypothetical protein